MGASGYEYLEKIVQIPFRIPQPGEEDIRAFISKQMGDPEYPSPEVEVKPDDGTQVGEPNEDADGEPPSGPLPPLPNDSQPYAQADTQAEAQVAFTYDELKGFQDVAPFLHPNPRHLKRLVNVYRLVRSLAAAKNERAILGKPVATIRWLVVCAQ